MHNQAARSHSRDSDAEFLPSSEAAKELRRGVFLLSSAPRSAIGVRHVLSNLWDGAPGTYLRERGSRSTRVELLSAAAVY